MKTKPRPRKKSRNLKLQSLESDVLNAALRWYRTHTHRNTGPQETELYNACWLLERFEVEE